MQVRSKSGGENKILIFFLVNIHNKKAALDMICTQEIQTIRVGYAEQKPLKVVITQIFAQLLSPFWRFFSKIVFKNNNPPCLSTHVYRKRWPQDHPRCDRDGTSWPNVGTSVGCGLRVVFRVDGLMGTGVILKWNKHSSLDVQMIIYLLRRCFGNILVAQMPSLSRFTLR